MKKVTRYEENDVKPRKAAKERFAQEQESDTFDFLVDIDEKVWVLAKKVAEKEGVTFKEYVERALLAQISLASELSIIRKNSKNTSEIN